MDKNYYKLDKTAFSVSSFDEESDEKKYWFSKKPNERLIALEYMRQMLYGYDPDTARLQRILTIVEPS